MDAAAKIRHARAVMGLTQAELARRAGTTQSAVAAYETGARVPAKETLERILGAARVRPSDVVRYHREEVLELAKKRKATDETSSS